MFNMTALRMTLKKAEKRKINAPEKLQFKMICWNFRKRDLSELIIENLQSTNNCQQSFLISWNPINGLLVSTNFNEESTTRSQTFAISNTHFSLFLGKRVFFLVNGLCSEFIKCKSWSHKMFVLLFIMANRLRFHQTNTPSWVYMSILLQPLLAQISTLYIKVW